MRYCRKKENLDSKIVSENLSYSNQNDRKKIRYYLKKEQRGFCAYSERYLKESDAVDIEHFDPGLKNTDKDGYTNWYLTLHWMNSHKPKKLNKRFLPIVQPCDPGLEKRMVYSDDIWGVNDPDDKEGRNLISYLGLNKHELVIDRVNHVRRLKELRLLCDCEDEFTNLLKRDPENLSFLTAIETEFNIPRDSLFQ